MNNILFIPETDRARGSGHLSRILFYIERCFPHAHILIAADARSTARIRLPSAISEKQIVSAHSRDASYRAVVVDRFKVTRADYRAYKQIAPIVCALDVRGSGNRYCEYIIDTLPRISYPPGNYRSTCFLPLLPVRQRRRAAASTALIYFGGRRKRRLMCNAIHYATTVLKCARPNITVVLSHGEPTQYRAVQYLFAPQSLQAILHRFQYVITAFGLTAFEARHGGNSVILINPTAYHRRLAQQSRFPIAKRRFFRWKTYNAHHIDSASYRVSTHAYRPFQREAFRDLLGHVMHTHPLCCPLCAHPYAYAVARFSYRSFVRCTRCKIVYARIHSNIAHAYDGSYFTKQYVAQYGKNYLRDTAKISAFSERRVAILNGLRRRRTAPALLDIGCAYGTFLSVAHRHGYHIYGLDVNRAAINYVHKNITAHARALPFETFDPTVHFQRGRFDIITMWYVIEHFDTVFPVLSKINALLDTHGIFAFSTPNEISILSRIDRVAELQSAPRDHYTLWNPRSVRPLLRRFGFQVQKIVIHGLHEEYYPSLAQSIATPLSRINKLGTTFSVYARKFRESNE